MKILITAGTGIVGKEVTKILLEEGYEPVVMTHTIDKLKNLPDGIEGVYCDLEKPKSWKPALKGITKLCLITPLLSEEAKRGCEFVSLACKEGVKQIVFLSIHNVEAGAHIPHFFAKMEIEGKIKELKIPYTIIRSNNLYQNDFEFLEHVEDKNLYLQPIGDTGLNRVDARDVAFAIVSALIDPEYLDKTFPIFGDEIITGRRVASLYSDVLGRRIIYPEGCLAFWEEIFQDKSHWLKENLKLMYEFFLKDGLYARGDAFDLRDKILRKRPIPYESFLKEMLSHRGFKSSAINNPSIKNINFPDQGSRP